MDSDSCPVLIDTGAQDPWALLLALAAHKESGIPFNIEAITCVHGETSVNNVASSVTRALKTANVKVCT